MARIMKLLQVAIGIWLVSICPCRPPVISYCLRNSQLMNNTINGIHWNWPSRLDHRLCGGWGSSIVNGSRLSQRNSTSTRRDSITSASMPYHKIPSVVRVFYVHFQLLSVINLTFWKTWYHIVHNQKVSLKCLSTYKKQISNFQNLPFKRIYSARNTRNTYGNGNDGRDARIVWNSNRKHCSRSAVLPLILYSYYSLLPFSMKIAQALLYQNYEGRRKRTKLIFFLFFFPAFGFDLPRLCLCNKTTICDLNRGFAFRFYVLWLIFCLQLILYGDLSQGKYSVEQIFVFKRSTKFQKTKIQRLSKTNSFI